MSEWGREYMWPDEWAAETIGGWLSRQEIPDPEEAIALAAQELQVERAQISLTAVLMRRESEVEARINGHEFPYWVECTARARTYERMWRVVVDRCDERPQDAPRSDAA